MDEWASNRTYQSLENDHSTDCAPNNLFFNGAFPVSFPLFSSFQFSWKYINVFETFANDWIRTTDLLWKRLLCQLSRNHCPTSTTLFTFGNCPMLWQLSLNTSAYFHCLNSPSQPFIPFLYYWLFTYSQHYRHKFSLTISVCGREPWSSGYGRRLTLWRSWVRIPVPYTRWILFHMNLL